MAYYQLNVLHDFQLAKSTFELVGKLLPSSSDVLRALGLIASVEGRWDESVAYFEQALALDPHNVELLTHAAWTYAMLRQFPAAVKVYDRALDITPNNADVMAAKATIYQAEGNLEQAGGLLLEINGQTAKEDTFQIKVTQLRLERNYAEAVRLLQSRLAQFRFTSWNDKGGEQASLAFIQRLAGDTVDAKVAAKEACNTFEPIYRDQPDNAVITGSLSLAYASMGEKDSALKAGERAIMLMRRPNMLFGPTLEENLALIQTIFGENSRAISTLTKLLQTPYTSWYTTTPITPALLRLDPIWDPLRADPAFQKLCEEKQP